MSTYPIFADAAWLRLGIVGLDILAVIITVRLCAAFTAWWRNVRPPGDQVLAGARIGRRQGARR
jgi:hypothetical protein